MSAETTRSRKPLYAALTAAVALLALLLVLGLTRPAETPPARSQDTPVAQVPRIEATPAPGSTIPVEQLHPTERIYIDGLRVWGTAAMDTHRWTDRDLLTYGKGTCVALEHAQNPADYLARMAALVPATAPHTPRSDLGTAEAEAVSMWCPEHTALLATMRP